MPQYRRNGLLLGGLLVLGVAGGLVLATLNDARARRSVEWLANARPVAPFALHSANGVFDNTALSSRWHLVLFGFTHCPDVCPATLAALGRLDDRLGEAPVQVVFISVDPARDTPARLARHVAFFSPDFTGVTGEEGELRALADSLGVRFARDGDGAVAHSVTISLLGPDGRLRGRLRPGFDVEAAARDIRAMAGQGA